MSALKALNTFDGTEERVRPAPGGNKENHKREQTKKGRYSGGGLIPAIGCKHSSGASAKHFCQAGKLTPDDLTMNFQKFYDTPNKVEQDRALLQLMTVTPVKRHRLKVGDEKRRKKREVTVQYSLLCENHPNKVSVCKATFTTVLGVSKDRVSRVALYYAKTADARPERRGGARNIEENDRRRQLILHHIQSFTCRASVRGAPGRRYLPRDLNVSKMHELFKAQNHADTSYSLYHQVFSRAVLEQQYDADRSLRRDTETILPELTEQHRIRLKEEKLSGQEFVHMAESETECAAPGLNTLEPECVTAHRGVSDVHHTHTSLIKTETDLDSTYNGDLIKTESLDFTELEYLTRLHPDQIKTEADDGKYLQAEHASDLQGNNCVKIEFDGIKCESSESSVGDVMNTMLGGAGVDHKDQTEPWQCTGNPNCKKEEINNLPTQCGALNHHGDVHNEYNNLRNIQERPNNANISAHCQRLKEVVEPMPVNAFINKIPKSEIHTDKISHKKCFGAKLSLNEQLRGHADDKPYKCAQCKKDFRSHSDFIIHQRTHTGEKPCKCTQCEKCFRTKAEVTIHLRSHTGEKPYKCVHCGKCFSLKSTLICHLKIHTGEKTFKCTQCEKCFKTKAELTMHLRIHTGEKPYNCVQCGKGFSQRSSLNSHLKIHTGEKPFKCTHCVKSFSRMSHLTSHLIIHTGEKPYKCTHCGKCFSQMFNLSRHLKIHSGEKPYKCTQCEKCFYTEANVTKHLRIHTGEKPYTCVQCGKGFFQMSTLSHHLKIHIGEKPYKCTQCEKCFYIKADLNKHLKVHTGEKPYTCVQCEKCFSRKSTLSRHMKIHGREMPNNCSV